MKRLQNLGSILDTVSERLSLCKALNACSYLGTKQFTRRGAQPEKKHASRTALCVRVARQIRSIMVYTNEEPD